jgi:hypothetical protein
MKVKQISLFLENKPGALSRPVKLLAKNKFNILTLSVADTQQFGILRLILQDWEKAVKVTDMVAIEVSDAPGGLSSILDALEKTHVNLEYMYGFTSRRDAKGMLVFRFDDPDRAIEALRKKGINPIGNVVLFKGVEG